MAAIAFTKFDPHAVQQNVQRGSIESAHDKPADLGQGEGAQTLAGLAGLARGRSETRTAEDNVCWNALPQKTGQSERKLFTKYDPRAFVATAEPPGTGPAKAGGERV